MTPRSRATTKSRSHNVTESAETRTFTTRFDLATWKRLNNYCRKIEDDSGKLPSKNQIVLEALNLYLDAAKKKR